MPGVELTFIELTFALAQVTEKYREIVDGVDAFRCVGLVIASSADRHRDLTS